MRKFLIWLLAFMPLIVAFILLPYLPTEIPAHYNSAGEITRWGSKYEVFITPIITLAFCSFMALISKFNSNPNNPSNAKVLEISNIIFALVFNIISYTVLYTGFKGITNISQFDFYKPITIAMCIMFIFLGNYLPKVKQNGFLGIRTTWTLNSSEVWYKTHRVGGKGMVLLGIVLTIVTLFLKGSYAMNITLISLVVYTIAISIYSWKISKKVHS